MKKCFICKENKGILEETTVLGMFFKKKCFFHEDCLEFCLSHTKHYSIKILERSIEVSRKYLEILKERRRISEACKSFLNEIKLVDKNSISIKKENQKTKITKIDLINKNASI